MADRSIRRSRRLALSLVLVAVALLAASAVALAGAPPARRTPKPRKHTMPKLTGWLASSVPFPERAVVLAPPPKIALTPAAISLSENGTPVTGFTLTPLSAGHPGDFGTVLAIDQNMSMSGSGLTAGLAAARALDASRAGAAQLGIVTFDSVTTRYLPLTADGSTIGHALASTPWTGTGANPSAAGSMALAQLAGAHVAAGAVIVISDGVGVAAASPAAQALRTAAAIAHVPIITIGVADPQATPASLHALAAQAPGRYVVATPAGLPAMVLGIQRSAQVGDVLRWRSSAPGGQTAAINVAVAGLVPFRTSVFDPAAPVQRAPIAPVPAAPTPAPAKARPVDPRAGLSFSPRFAPRGTLTAIPVFPKVTPSAVADPSPSPAPAVQVGFWGSSRAVVLVAVLCGILIALVLLLVLHRPYKRAVRLRVGSFVDRDPEPGEAALTIAAPESRPGGPLAMLARSNWWPPFVEAVEVSRSPHSPMTLVKRAAAIGMVLAVVATVALGTPAAGLVCLILWPFALRTFVNRAAEKQRTKFSETLPTYLQDLSSAMRIGRSLVSGLNVIAEDAEEPMRSELERAVTDEALGRPLERSLQAVARRMRSDDMDQVALIAELNRRSGSNVAEALDRVAEGARERSDLRREIKALTAQAKMSSLVLTALPGVLLLGLSIVSPHYSYPLFHTTLGVVALSFGAALVLAGWKVMQKITLVEA